MKKNIFALALCFLSLSLFAQENDSLRVINLQEIQVTATRATSTTPVTNTFVSKEQIKKTNFGQDIPFLLTLTPSVVATSDAGAGIGYTGIRIRGVDASRINITANGIPMNDAESHSVFWVNMPDFASSLQDVQVQRGVGTSTNGAGAFGASVNMKTEFIDPEPYGEVSFSGGSYGTHREIIKVGTGTINDMFSFNARLSSINSGGYIDRASVKLRSYFVQGAYHNKNSVLKFITFSGREKTYHAWNGIDGDQMNKNRRYNPCGEIKDTSGNVIGFYKDQTDNYKQTHYQLLFNQYINENWNLNFSLHYTKGRGFYEEYKNKGTLVQYGLAPFSVNGIDITKSDIIRRKQMDNDFGGGIFSVNYAKNGVSASLGGGINKYSGSHWGDLIWVKNYVGALAPDHKYYTNNSTKIDANIFAKINYAITSQLNLYGDIQYRRISHEIKGNNDKWDWNNSVMQNLNIDNTYNFLNPKAGLTYQFDQYNKAYVSLAIANKEPTRNNFTNAKLNATPKSERLFDYELGYNFAQQNFAAGVTLYYMDYKNQLVLTGETNEIGEALTANVDNSYRAGIEFTAGIKICDWLRWDLNTTLSRNQIKNYTEYIDNVDEKFKPLGTQTTNFLKSTTISNSPSIIAGSFISANFGDFNIALQSNYVGEQYVTNSGQKDVKLDAYFVNNIRADYTFKTKSLGTFNLGLVVNNILNAKYSSNGWGGSSYVHKADGSKERAEYIGYYPQATCNFLINLSVRF